MSTSGSGGAAVDRKVVDVVLDRVLKGLRAVTSISSGSSVISAADDLSRASRQFALAGRMMAQPPAGVPTIVAAPVASRILQLRALFYQSAVCLKRQSRASPPQPRTCLPPLRRANAKDGEFARALISFASYSTMSPKAFEAKLVAALR